jgi:hypothetical protein
MFSTGMPILYPFGCIFYAINYWVYKLLLVKYYAKTTMFNHELPMYSTRFIKSGLMLHVVMGGFMVTNSEIIPSKEELDITAQGELPTSDDFDFTELYTRFLTKNHGLYYFIFIVFIISFLIFKNTLFALLISIAKKLYKVIVKPKDEEKCGSHCFYKELHIADLKCLYNKSVEEIQKFKQIKVDTSQFVEHRLPEE